MAQGETRKLFSLPDWWLKSAAFEREPGTNWWVERGNAARFRHWARDVRKMTKGNVLPLQWVAEFVGVTPAAVRRRAQAGGMTVLTFIIVEPRKSVFGNVSERESRRRYDYAIMSECEDWYWDILERFGD